MSRDAVKRIFPDMGSLVDFMNLKCRPAGDEELREQYVPMYERSHAHADGWGTHAPLLAAVVATARVGTVLEVGVGRCSSPLLVEMCRAMNRPLVGIDNTPAWVEEVRDIGYPNLLLMPDWSHFPEWIGKKKFAVIFIDHGPGEARLPVLQACRGHAEFIVCHDTHNPNYLIGLDAELDTYKYRYDYLEMPSCTSVVSDDRPYDGAVRS